MSVAHHVGAALTQFGQHAFDLHLESALDQGSSVSSQQFGDRVSHLALQIRRGVEVGRYDCHGSVLLVG